jgi:hypothetical protein
MNQSDQDIRNRLIFALPPALTRILRKLLELRLVAGVGLSEMAKLIANDPGLWMYRKHGLTNAEISSDLAKRMGYAKLDVPSWRCKSRRIEFMIRGRFRRCGMPFCWRQRLTY